MEPTLQTKKVEMRLDSKRLDEMTFQFFLQRSKNRQNVEVVELKKEVNRLTTLVSQLLQHQKPK